MTSGSLTVLLAIAVVLLLINGALTVLMVTAARRNAKLNKQYLNAMQMQNRYMDNTEEFCQKTGEMIDAIEASISNGSVAQRDEEHLNICAEILSYMHGGDSVAEAVIADKKYMCQEAGVKFIDEIKRLPESGSIAEMDIVSILGNLLDNAIEAASQVDGEERFIKCESRIDRGIWALTVTNSKRKDVRISSGNVPTTKADKANHGLGIGIVRNAVSTYHGALKFTDNGDNFVAGVKVILK